MCCCKQQVLAAYAVSAQLGTAALRQARWPYPALDAADANLPALLSEPCELEAALAPDRVDLGCAHLQPAATLHEPKEPEGSEPLCLVSALHMMIPQHDCIG